MYIYIYIYIYITYLKMFSDLGDIKLFTLDFPFLNRKEGGTNRKIAPTKLFAIGTKKRFVNFSSLSNWGVFLSCKKKIVSKCADVKWGGVKIFTSVFQTSFFSENPKCAEVNALGFRKGCFCQKSKFAVSSCVVFFFFLHKKFSLFTVKSCLFLLLPKAETWKLLLC